MSVVWGAACWCVSGYSMYSPWRSASPFLVGVGRRFSAAVGPRFFDGGSSILWVDCGVVFFSLLVRTFISLLVSGLVVWLRVTGTISSLVTFTEFFSFLFSSGKSSGFHFE